jgi:ribonuclease VapC
VLGLRRNLDCPLAVARESVENFVAAIGAVTIPVNDVIGDAALDAHERFGKGRHKAALNMGDCFAYACARVHNVPLLFKGDDFVHTDIAVA